jgi:hypothetical protein
MEYRMVERLDGRMEKGMEKSDRISVGLLSAATDWRLRVMRAFWETKINT